MKYKVWLVSIVYIVTITINGMEKNPSSELMGPKEYNKVIMGSSYSKEEKTNEKINKAVIKLVNEEPNYFLSFMPKKQYKMLQKMAYFLAGLPPYRDKIKQDQIKYTNEGQPELIAVTLNVFDFLETQEATAKSLIWDAIKKYPGKL